MFEGQPIGMGETTIVADTKGVNATSAGIEMRIPWDKVQDVIVTNEHLFLMFCRLVGVIDSAPRFRQRWRSAAFRRVRAQQMDAESHT